MRGYYEGHYRYSHYEPDIRRVWWNLKRIPQGKLPELPPHLPTPEGLEFEKEMLDASKETLLRGGEFDTSLEAIVMPSGRAPQETGVTPAPVASKQPRQTAGGRLAQCIEKLRSAGTAESPVTIDVSPCAL